MTKVVIIGAGKGGRALLEMFSGDPTVTIIGVADVNPWAPGLELARRLNVAVSTDLRELVADPRVDLIIDVTGNGQVQETIERLKPPGTEVMGGASAKFMWDLLAERKRSEELEDRYSLMLRELQAKAEGDFIIGQNPKMRELAEQMIRVAQTPTTVLIRGESGTGKELVARAIHRYSNLRDKPLVTVNCTALTPTLMESELFGHKRGSFTGAVADKVGLFEQADEVKPVGDVVTRKVRVRVIAATNRDLEKALAGSEFREDLFYRFNAFTVVLPPLRERSEDIPVLAYHFLRKAEAKVNKKVDRFSQDALDMLRRYTWPGNLRELENIIERAVVLSSSQQVEVALLPLYLQESGPIRVTSQEGFVQAKERVVSMFEKEAVARFLSEARGNVSVAAQKAGITRRNFHRLISKYSINTKKLS